MLLLENITLWGGDGITHTLRFITAPLMVFYSLPDIGNTIAFRVHEHVCDILHTVYETDMDYSMFYSN